jgi:hypothetical protein
MEPQRATSRKYLKPSEIMAAPLIHAFMAMKEC